MKKFRFFIFFSLIICCLLAFIGCGKTKLERPTNLQIDQDTLVLTWDEVENARYYTISINGENDDSSKNSYSLSKLEAGEYKIKVKASTSGKNRSSSKWSATIPFVREQEPGMIFKLINDGTEYELANVGTAEGDIVVPSTYRNRPVTSIGRRAFAGKPKVTSVVLPETITNIGEQAFNKCSYLKTVNIPDGVKTIGAKAFQSCSVLESEIVIPAGVTELSDGVFNYCYSVPKITIGANVKTIGEFTFANCTAITEIVIPDSVKAIGLSAFSDCTMVSTLTMGTGLVSIGNESFSGCGSLTSVTIPENVESIGTGAFLGCTNIESVSMSDKVLAIGGEAFKGCTKLAEFDLSTNMQSIGYNAFLNTKIWEDETNLVYVGNWLVDSKDKKAATYVVKDGTVGIAVGAMALLEVTSQIVLPDSVKIIDVQAFYYCLELTTVEIGSGVEVIRTQAFANNKKLSKAILGSWDWEKNGGKGGLDESSLTRIEQYAFMGCTVLTSIDIPDTVEFIGGYAFRKTGLSLENGIMYADDWIVDYDATTLTFMIAFGMWDGTLNVKEGTRGIGEYALYKATMYGVNMPDSVEIINRCAFMESGYLQSVNFPANLKRIEEYTFLSCTYLMDCDLPETLEYIGTGAFRNCMILGLSVENNAIKDSAEDTFVIPNSVKVIGDYAFYGGGAEVVINEETQETAIWGADILIIGDGVTTIGKCAFANFLSVKDVRLGANVETIGEKAFYKATALKKVSFGEKVTSMGKRAFYGCTLLEEVTLPNSLTEISEYAFYKCEAVKSITLGNAVTTIGKYAFYGCAALESLTLPETVTSIGKLSFRNANLVKSFVIGENVATIDNYAFYNWKNVTFYVEGSAAGESWAERWNASHRPVVWGVTLSEEGYVVSFTKTETSVENAFENVTVNAPERAGYTFAGWTSVQGGTTAEYTAAEIVNVPVGTVLYAIWTPQVAA